MKHNKIVLLAKILKYHRSLNWLIYCHKEFVFVNNVLQKYDGIKGEIKNLMTLTNQQRF